MTPPRLPLLGVHVSAVNLPLALAQLDKWIKNRQREYVCVAPAHSLMECVDQPALLPVFNGAGMVTPDGMAVVWLLKLRGHKQVARVYGPDLLFAACEFGLPLGWRHYFYGGAPGIATQLAETLQKRIPNLKIAGTCSPPFGRPAPEKQNIINQQINANQADIVWVGMSSPWQETWMSEQRANLNAPVLIGVGAAFDFLTGRKPQAPRWMQKTGLEWLFRFASEPKRLWPRYKHYPRFVWLALRELLQG
jgi:N-acetylglucosaminyldiphosphoundecaprenol N-acetyl-beta-D-mannosaminyltransferase